MNVGELKKVLNQLNDSLEIFATFDDSGDSFRIDAYPRVSTADFEEFEWEGALNDIEDGIKFFEIHLDY